MTHSQLLEQLAEEDKALRCDDPRFKTVYINHHEGIYLQENAFCEVRGDQLVVMGEHIKPITFDLFSVYSYAQFDLEYPPDDSPAT